MSCMYVSTAAPIATTPKEATASGIAICGAKTKPAAAPMLTPDNANTPSVIPVAASVIDMPLETAELVITFTTLLFLTFDIAPQTFPKSPGLSLLLSFSFEVSFRLPTCPIPYFLKNNI